MKVSSPSDGRRCPHCLGELEPGAGAPAEVAPENNDGVIGSGQAVHELARKWIREQLKPKKAPPKARRRRRKP